MDTSFYDLFGVSPDASSSQIRKAYYQRARSCHPDKHPGDAAKEAAFKELSEARRLLERCHVTVTEPHVAHPRVTQPRVAVQEAFRGTQLLERCNVTVTEPHVTQHRVAVQGVI